MKKLFLLAISFLFFGFVLANFIEIEAARPSYNVTVTALYDTGNQPTSDLGPRVYGSTVTPYTEAPAGYEFVYWIVNGVIQENVYVDSEFIVTTTLDLVAVFAPTTPVQKYAVVFMDTNWKVLETQYVLLNGDAAQPLATLPTKPLFDVAVEANRWKTDEGRTSLTNIIKHELFILQYVSTNTDLYAIGVNNGFGGGSYGYNDIVTATPDTSVNPFRYWEDENGVVLSYLSTFKFTAAMPTQIYAYTADADPYTESLVTLSRDLEIRPGYNTYIGRFEASEGDFVLEYGFLISDQAEILTFETPGVTVVQAKSAHPETNEFVTSFPITSHMSVRAYVVIKDSYENVVDIYSEVNHRYIEDIVYETGFESAEGFTASTTYNSTLTQGPALSQWEFYYGTSSTTSPISGTQSAQMRWYTTAPANLGYVKSNFYFDNVDYVEFLASSTLGLNVTVSYTLNGTDFIGDQLYTLTGTPEVYKYVLPKTSSVSLKFTVALPDPIPTGTSRLYIDNVKAYSLYKGDVLDVYYSNDSVVTNQVVKLNQLISDPNPTKLGYTSDGWYRNSSFTPESEWVFEEDTVYEITWLYIKWLLNDYTISYTLNGGTNGSNPTTYTVETETITLDPATKTGYTFDGWYNNSEFTGDAVTSIPKGSTGNITLYAKFTVNQYTITFDSNEGSAVSAITQDFGSSVTQPSDPTLAEYTFEGWFTDDTTFLNEYTFTTMPAQNNTLYAYWVAVPANQSTVTFNSNGGSAVTAITQDEGTSVSAPTDPTKAGYTFAGWKLGSEDKSFPFNMPAEDITLDAQWTIVTYSITYELDSGTNGANTDTYTVTTATITLIAATKDGYTFGGWYDNSGFTGDAVTSIVLGSTGNVTLYAKWTIAISGPFATYTFTHITTSSSTSYTDITLKASLDNGLTGTNKLVSTTGVLRTYPGNASSGTYQQSTLLKMGNSTSGGVFTMNFADANVTKVIIFIEPWTTVSNFNLTINTLSKAIPQSAGGSLTYEFGTPTNTLAFSTNGRAFIFRIELYSE
ncbi:MAG TPA: hypothetical protein DEP70_04465 [Acholeplasmataceae bacterium]|nr:hypothetical protein [Acholeplasmataceae bacterium]